MRITQNWIMILNIMNKYKTKILYTALLLVFAMGLSAQDGRGRGPKMDREKLQAARIAFLTNRLDLTPDNAKEFWPIFNEYEKKKNELNRDYNKQKRALVAEEGLRNISDENAVKMLEIYMEQKQAELNLEKEYLDKFQSVLPPTKVWMVLRFDSEFRRNLMQRIGRSRNGNTKQKDSGDR